MANEPHHSGHGEVGFEGNAEGVFGEQQQRPGIGEKVKITLASVKEKISGHQGEHDSHLPGSDDQDDPQMHVGHPSEVYGNSGNRLGSGGENTLHRRAHSPHSPHVAVGHNPEFEPIGVGEQGADSVMPGRFVDHHPDPSSPHHQPRVEKFLEKLPGYAQNPYKHYDHVPVGNSLDAHEHHHHPSPLRDPERQHVVGEAATEDLGEDYDEHSEKRHGIISKLKVLVTGQKPGQGAGTGHATTDQIAETMGEHAVDEKTGHGENFNDGTESYTQEPTNLADGDFFGSVKQKLRVGGHQGVRSQQGWPVPAKPDYHSTPGGVVRTDDQGKTILGAEEEGKSPKREGVISKITEKLHIGQQKPASDHTETSLASPAAPDTTFTHQQ